MMIITSDSNSGMTNIIGNELGVVSCGRAGKNSQYKLFWVHKTCTVCPSEGKGQTSMISSLLIASSQSGHLVKNNWACMLGLRERESNLERS